MEWSAASDRASHGVQTTAECSACITSTTLYINHPPSPSPLHNSFLSHWFATAYNNLSFPYQIIGKYNISTIWPCIPCKYEINTNEVQKDHHRSLKQRSRGLKISCRHVGNTDNFWMNIDRWKKTYRWCATLENFMRDIRMSGRCHNIGTRTYT